MKKALLSMAALCAALLIAAYPALYTKADGSAEGLRLSLPLEGEWRKPADDPQAFCYYVLPQFEPDSEAARAINLYYQTLDPQLYASEGERLTFECAHLSQRYVSVVLTASAIEGMGGVGTIHADTFALDGLYCGNRITLSQLLGVEQADEVNVVSEVVYSLVWRIVERESQNAEGDYLDGVTQEDVRASFQPETDFYLDSDGNIVFFIQAGEIAGEIAGVLSFPFSPAEILSGF